MALLRTRTTAFVLSCLFRLCSGSSWCRRLGRHCLPLIRKDAKFGLETQPLTAFVALSSRSNRHISISALNAAPKRGSIVESYQTVSVNCNSCKNHLFRYKKKNGTKSNLIKCYIERICEDPNGLLEQLENSNPDDVHEWTCPNCGIHFARDAVIHGRPALKLVGGKTRMTKK